MGQSENINRVENTHNMRFKITLISVLALLVIAISLTFFIFSFSKPYMGVVLSKGDTTWVVESLDSNGLAIKAGIEEGDIPTEINMQQAHVFLSQYENVGVVFGHVVADLTVTNENEETKSASIAGSSQSWQSLTEVITWLIVCMVFWIVGLFVFLKKPRDLSTMLLCLCGLSLGLAISANLAAERMIPVAFWLGIIATVIGPWLLLHFFLVLPEERSWTRNNYLIYLIYLPAVLTLILFPILGYANGQALPGFRTVRLFEYGIGFLAVVGVAIFNYFQAYSPKIRNQMKIVLISCLAALIPFLILNIIPVALEEHSIIPSGFNFLFIIFIPVGLGYAVITQKLMDIDIVVRRGIIYGLISMVMAIILTIAIFIVVISQESLSILEEAVIALALGALATILFGPTKQAIEVLVDKFFYRDRYDYRRIIENLSTTLKLHNDLTSISRLIIGTSANTLNLAGVCLLIKNQSGTLEIRASLGTFSDTNRQQQLLNLINQSGNEIFFPDSVSSINPEVEFLIPLISAEREVGILCLSHKNTGQDFSSSDLYLIQGLASIAAIALHSALLTRDVSVRDTFVSVASHELRTPMSAIMGYAELLLQRDPPKDTRKQWLENILESSKSISQMIDDLLNVSRIQAGRVAMNIQSVDIIALVKTRVKVLRETYDTREVVINCNVELPKAAVDNDKFGQIIGNLLDNAVKYSPDRGRITISSHLDKKENRIVVSVTDEGIGISPEDRELLFTTFHRIQRTETQGIRGSGLGLYIVKEWTEAMGGAVWLESELNKGSTFYLAVPISENI